MISTLYRVSCWKCGMSVLAESEQELWQIISGRPATPAHPAMPWQFEPISETLKHGHFRNPDGTLRCEHECRACVEARPGYVPR